MTSKNAKVEDEATEGPKTFFFRFDKGFTATQLATIQEGIRQSLERKDTVIFLPPGVDIVRIVEA